MCCSKAAHVGQAEEGRRPHLVGLCLVAICDREHHCVCVCVFVRVVEGIISRLTQQIHAHTYTQHTYTQLTYTHTHTLPCSVSSCSSSDVLSCSSLGVYVHVGVCACFVLLQLGCVCARGRVCVRMAWYCVVSPSPHPSPRLPVCAMIRNVCAYHNPPTGKTAPPHAMSLCHWATPSAHLRLEQCGTALLQCAVGACTQHSRSSRKEPTADTFLSLTLLLSRTRAPKHTHAHANTLVNAQAHEYTRTHI